MISSWRQDICDFEVNFVPFANVNGSGRLEFVAGVYPLGRVHPVAWRFSRVREGAAMTGTTKRISLRQRIVRDVVGSGERGIELAYC